MFIDTDDIIISNFYINTAYLNRTTYCRSEDNDSFFITKGENKDLLTIDIEIIFISIHNCDVVAKAKFTSISTFQVTRNKVDDLISIEYLFGTVYSDIETSLKENIPLDMISPVSPALYKHEIKDKANAVLLELVKHGFYE